MDYLKGWNQAFYDNVSSYVKTQLKYHGLHFKVTSGKIHYFTLDYMDALKKYHPIYVMMKFDEFLEIVKEDYENMVEGTNQNKKG